MVVSVVAAAAGPFVGMGGADAAMTDGCEDLLESARGDRLTPALCLSALCYAERSQRIIGVAERHVEDQVVMKLSL
jgi:hypothetical protein